MSSSIENSEKPGIHRPKFLTFLCYLTIFGSSWVFTQSVSSLMNPEQVSIAFSKNLEEMQDKFEGAFKADPAAGEQVEKLIINAAAANSVSNTRDHSVFSMIANILTLIGAALMLRLKRNGFRLYLLGTIISIIAPILVFGGSNLLGLAFAFYSGFFGVIFVILYAVKLKYMD
jgi:hypothetical protein